MQGTDRAPCKNEVPRNAKKTIDAFLDEIKSEVNQQKNERDSPLRVFLYCYYYDENGVLLR